MDIIISTVIVGAEAIIISLDYDKTYTTAPILWEKFIEDFSAAGHKVICLTMRYPTEEIKSMSCRIYYTSRKAKKLWAEANGIAVDIWIDDSPGWLFEDAWTGD